MRMTSQVAAQIVRTKKTKTHDFPTEKISPNDHYFDKVKQIIEREFKREIDMKQHQLEEIDERLEKAKHLLERLRYGIVSEYYKKQEIPLNAIDAATLRGNDSLFDKEEKGPQMPIHPSIKKLIGKRPKDLSEVMRTCPRRTAAQNAVQTIRSKSQAQKREERKLKQIIKEQGIVIDHSKQNATTENDVNALLNTAAQNSLKSSNNTVSSVFQPENDFKDPNNTPQSGKSLNASRLNNKIKHLIVVGNTSKYIGNEMDKDTKSHAQNLTHKWLVYVQSKETKYPIERFIKKVRFHLHRSYRPNDVVDIESPPFQVSRRGWGEFPIRVQLFFQPEFHQKPVQLIHNIILDQTLSGIQTLGAETLLEIWLRDIKSTSAINKELKDAKPELEVIKKPEAPTKPRPSFVARNEELVDDNLLDFLNKIEASPCSISADIEKIQPTVLVNEPLGVKIKSPSPVKYKQLTTAQQRTPTKISNLEERMKSPEKPLANFMTTTTNPDVSTAELSSSVTLNSQLKTAISANGSLTTKPIISSVNLELRANPAPVKLVNTITTVASNISPIPPLKPITSSLAHAITTQKPPVILNKDGKILMPSASVASAVRKTILPIGGSVSTNVTALTNTTSQISQNAMTNKLLPVSTPSTSAPMTFNAPKQILQKKLVQLVDSTGKVKYIQMLVAASSASSSVPAMSKSPAAPKLITMAPSFVKNNTVTNTTQITKTVTTPILKSPNGVTLMPAMTTKPNIFKIVPESMQTKPQILTFSTAAVGTTFTNTPTTASNRQQLQNLITAASQNMKPLTVPSGPATNKCTTVTLPVANKFQKPNIPTKNLVFQKEGKVYIIDPQQMKYKQQQKKQVSLLKPQISLLKQQQQKQLAQSAAGNSPSRIDTSKSPNINVAPIHFGLKQQRINSISALQLMQMKRMLFEKQFLRQEFTNMRPAVDFLLRRLKLVVPKDSLVADFPFVSHTLQEFHSLTAFKQRAYEWLRAKNISRLLRSHKDLQRLNNSSKELFWSTKEIATFARQYAYTPPIKSLPKPGDQQQSGENNKEFVDLVKSELKQEPDLQYDTLTDHHKVRKWIERVWHTFEEYEQCEDEYQIIDIDNIEEEKDKRNNKQIEAITNTSSIRSSKSLDTYLSPPSHLENQCQLVSDICKDLNIKLAYEELETKVYHPSTQTVLAHCLHLFIEKLLRKTIALKQDSSSVYPSVIDSICTLMPQDFAKVLASNSEFDFITNNNFGSASLAESLETSLKQENP